MSVVYKDGRAENVKVAYIGGGSRGWAWMFMGDLCEAPDMSGSVDLYDIDFEAAKNNEIIGNKFSDLPEATGKWVYTAKKTIGEALTGADFVVISILPGTFDEMESDVHWPEKYGIYQPVGDSTGPGGIIRAMRTVPMFEEIAHAIRDYCPKAWVINYTNPMTLCTKTLYKAFPEIRAVGCCHEVFGTQNLLKHILKSQEGIEVKDRREIKTNVVGVNHFTWLTEAHYKNIDIFPIYDKFVDKVLAGTVEIDETDKSWLNRSFTTANRVKYDLFKRYGVLAAAGDRHLSEFCEGSWYLDNPEQVEKWGFKLTTVAWRREDLGNRLARSAKLISGEEKAALKPTGEEGVLMMRGLLGLCDVITNVNMPNAGQIPNLPLGAVVETNALFTADSVRPVMAGPIPEAIYPLITRIVGEQEMVAEGCFERDLNKIFNAFANDQLVRLPLDQAKKMFNEMIENTKQYLTMYPIEK